MCCHGEISDIPVITGQVPTENVDSAFYLSDKVSEAWRKCNLIEVDFTNQP